MSTHKSISDELLTKEELAARLRVPSIRIIEQMMRKRQIPFIKLGHRTVRFDWVKVEQAVARLETAAIK
jgi:excisionase family DNA binding protein